MCVVLNIDRRSRLSDSLAKIELKLQWRAHLLNWRLSPTSEPVRAVSSYSVHFWPLENWGEGKKAEIALTLATQANKSYAAKLMMILPPFFG